MKIAVSAKAPDIEAEVDPRFGRAPYIVIVNSEDMSFETIDNEKDMKAFQGAGIQTASSISEKGAEVLLTGHCGPKAFKVVDAAGIKVVNDVTGSVKSAVETLLAGKYSYSSEANVEGHW